MAIITIARRNITAGREFAASVAVPNNDIAILKSDIEPVQLNDPSRDLTFIAEVATGTGADNTLTWQIIVFAQWQGYVGPPFKGTDKNLAVTLGLQPYWGKKLRLGWQSQSGITTGATIDLR
jgi:hypothetical protein